jgi:hypothetical protein
MKKTTFNEIKNLVKQILNEQILLEGASDIMYHFTSFENCMKILKNNNFVLSPALNNEYERLLNNNRFFFLSTTRSRSSGFINGGDIKLVLDGRKLKNRYKFLPVDYFGNTGSDIKMGSEQEDRLVSDNPIIPNARNYILAVHHIKKYNNSFLTYRLNILCDKYDIPLYIYKEEDDFLNQRNYSNKKMDDNVFLNVGVDEEQEEFKDNVYEKFKEDLSFILALISYKNDKNYNSIINYFDDYELKSFIDDELRNIEENKDKIKKDYEDEDDSSSIGKYDYIISKLNQGEMKNKEYRQWILRMLVKDMKNYNSGNLKSYYRTKLS